MSANFFDYNDVDDRNGQLFNEAQHCPYPALTWLTEAAIAVSLIHADAVNARRRVAARQFFLAVKSDKARRTGAVSPAIVSDETRSSVMTHHGIARVELLLTKLAFESCARDAIKEKTQNNTPFNWAASFISRLQLRHQ